MSETTDKIKFLGMEGTKALLEGLKGEYSPLGHEHSDLIEAINKITDGSTTVSKAEEAVHSSTADTATNATHAETADAATKAEQDGQGNVIADTYALKVEAVLTTEQTFTDEQKAQARANISQIDWKTCSDEYGTYTYAIAENTIDYDVAQTIANASDGTMTALEEMASWLLSVFGLDLKQTGFVENNIKNIAVNFMALKNGNAFTDTTTNDGITVKLYLPVIINNDLDILETVGFTITLIYFEASSNLKINVSGRKVATVVTFNTDSNTIVSHSSAYHGVTTTIDNLTYGGSAADAKVVGDALALKMDSDAELITVEDIDEICGANIYSASEVAL